MEITQRDTTAVYTTRDGSLIRELMHPDATSARNQSLAEATVLPGQTTLEHYHVRSEELYHIVSGNGVMMLDGEQQSVGPGATVLIAPGQRHAITNDGAEPLVLLCCCAPPYSHEDTFLVEADAPVPAA